MCLLTTGAYAVFRESLAIILGFSVIRDLTDTIEHLWAYGMSEKIRNAFKKFQEAG